MKVDIPDQLIINILGFHPDISVKEAVRMFVQNRVVNKRTIHEEIGRTVLERFVENGQNNV